MMTLVDETNGPDGRYQIILVTFHPAGAEAPPVSVEETNIIICGLKVFNVLRLSLPATARPNYKWSVFVWLK